MTSRVPGLFQALASRLNVNEAELLVLIHEKIVTADDIFFRIPDEESLKLWITWTLMQSCGHMDAA